MKYVATLHFESNTEPLDDCDTFVQSVQDNRYVVTDFNIEPINDEPESIPTTASDA